MRTTPQTPEYQRSYRAANSDHLNAMGRRRYKRRAAHFRSLSRNHRAGLSDDGRNQVRNYLKRYYETNKEEQQARGKAWNRRNQSRRREIARNYMARVRATPSGCLNHRMSTAILLALKSNKSGHRWEQLVGYTLTDLKRHLEIHFKEGMTWGLLLAGKIHIDHVIPKSKFNYASSSDLQFRQCWALENLKPEWAKVNLSKGGRLLRPAQIPLGV